MKVKTVNVNGLQFACRPDTSDEKTVAEVVSRDVYQTRGMIIEPGENWLDFGGNIGAFTVLAVSKGATVTAYEPDPISVKLLRHNIALNGYEAEVVNAGVVAGNKTHAVLNVSKTGQFWRNSLEHSWGGLCVEVETKNIHNIVKPTDCVKMDIEGSEMAILEQWSMDVPKLVFEWSFDIDPDIDRYRRVIERLGGIFSTVKADTINPKHKVWQKSWFPPAKMVFCWR